MVEWKELEEEGVKSWVSEEHGQIIQIGDNLFLSMIPKVVKLGPFNSLEQAKIATVHGKNNLEETIERFEVENTNNQ